MQGVDRCGLAGRRARGRAERSARAWPAAELGGVEVLGREVVDIVGELSLDAIDEVLQRAVPLQGDGDRSPQSVPWVMISTAWVRCPR